MPLRFYRRFRAGPLRMNLRKRGASFSVGGKGAWITVGHHRVRASVDIPGTGLGWYETQRLPSTHATDGTRKPPSIITCALWLSAALVLMGIAVAMIGATP